jgi:hypothetical protein
MWAYEVAQVRCACASARQLAPLTAPVHSRAHHSFKSERGAGVGVVLSRAQKWPAVELCIVDSGGHSVWDEPMCRRLVKATDDVAAALAGRV